ncbi:TELO2-interacting protein 1 homolog isoform X2 [Ischnura elegans]|uniref:TELO2-interacting protein 1 homolog isoform X2 n=1 Tax=Ischnura elegans TaxID=197161 RepID=UPI001ED88752|nr:TELO2-interacting protein 1 homolog isoform X2 [Ischnura elegans]
MCVFSHLNLLLHRMNVSVKTVDCLSSLLAKTKVLEVDQLTRIFSELFRSISDPSLHKLAPNSSEELKISVTRCVKILISRSSHEILTEFYCERNIPLISHGIYFCLSLVKEELFVDLRVTALECLMHVCQVHGEEFSRYGDSNVKIGHLLMFCFPGITLSLKIVICADEKQNHKITMAAIKAWSRVTAVVMEDAGISEADQFECSDWEVSKNDLLAFLWRKSEGKSGIDSREHKLSTLRGKERTKEWYAHASQSIQPVVSEICLLYFSNWNVRLEMAKAAQLLLTCSRNLKECVPSLVGALLILSEDEMPAVAQMSKAALETFAKEFNEGKSFTLIEVMEDHFLKVTHKLSFSTLGEDELKISLNLLCGYLRLLGKHAYEVLKSSVHLRALLSAIFKIITVDYLVVSPVEDWSLGTSGSDLLTATLPWKTFKCFKDVSIFRKCKDICELLALHSDLTVLSDTLLQLFFEDVHNRREITLLINHVFSSVTSSQSEIVFPIVKRIIVSYLDPEIWLMELCPGFDSGAVVSECTVAEIRGMVVQACLLVEGLGMMSRVMTSAPACAASMDVWYFRVCLYPILERIGQPNAVLAGAGKLSLALISQSTRVDIPSIIHSNSDYVLRHVVLKLRNTSGFSSPAPLHVFVAVLEFSSPSTFNELEEAVESVLNYGFKYINHPRSSNCLKSLLIFTKFVNIKFPKSRNMNMGSVCDGDEVISFTAKTNTLENGTGQVTRRIMDYVRLKEAAVGGGVESEGEKGSAGDAADDSMESDTIQKPPKHVMLTVEVLRQILTFISSKERERKLMAMDILSEGIQVAEGYDDELLPLVHKVWTPLSAQFATDDPLLMHRAFNLLMVLSVAAKSFIRDRTLRKVLPEIRKFLLKQSKISLKKDSASAYRFSQAYKLQCSLLNGLGELAVNVEFQEQDISEMLTATAPYLSCQQPQPLQDACIKTYKLACTLDHNIVFLKLAHMRSILKEMQPPSHEFKVYLGLSQTSSGVEYHKNVSRLLNDCIFELPLPPHET